MRLPSLHLPTAPRLAPRDRRALTLGSAVLGPLLVFALVIRPAARALVTRRERVREERALLARELAAIRARDANDAVAQRGRVLLDSAGTHLLEGDDALAASAALAAYVRDLAEGSGLHLEGTEASGPDLSDVRLEIRADGDLAAIVGFLRDIEDGEKLARVERVGIDRHGPEGDATNGARLTLSATVRGYTRAWYASTTATGGAR